MVLLKIFVAILAIAYCSFFISRNVAVLKGQSERKVVFNSLLEIIACVAILSIAAFWCFGTWCSGTWNAMLITGSVFALLLLATLVADIFRFVKNARKNETKGTTAVLYIALKLIGLAFFVSVLYASVARIGSL